MMLTQNRFDNWCHQQNIPEYTRKIIEQVRSSDPSRSVQGGKSNVCGFYPSQKMGVSIQFESHRNELAHIVDKLEHSDDVLEYYDQPSAIELNYLSKKGMRVRRLHTPDFFVIRREGAGWEECKTEEELVQLSEKSPHRYVRDQEGRWGCPPGEEHAQKYGLYYCLRSSAEINPVRMRNQIWLEPYFCGKSLSLDEFVRKALIKIVESEPGITFAQLLLRVVAASPDDINILIATEQVYVNLSAAPLAQPDQVRIFLNKEIAKAYKQITTDVLPSTVAACASVLKVDVGITLSWDGECWEIINTGGEKISLTRADGKVASLLNTTFNALVEQGEIKGFEIQTESNIRQKVEEILRSARPKDIASANRRYEVIEPYLLPNPPSFPNSSIRRWLSSYTEASKIYGNGYIGLLPLHSKKGSRKPKLDEAVLRFMVEYIAQYYETAKKRRITGVYRAFKQACKAHEPPLEPPSEKRFRLEIKRRSGYEQTQAREGSRVVNLQKPFHSTEGIPRGGDLTWSSAHIDHTQIDDELVSSLISLVTCNSSSAMSLNDISLGRPWATFMIDSYSRRILAVYISYEEPSRRSCMMVMRICVQRCQRLPQTIVTDNGKEFHSIYFKQLLAYYRCTQKYRPPSEPRYGAPIERVFNTTNTQWLHELKGNTQILQKRRSVTKSVNPKGQAVWTLGEFYQFLEYWAYWIDDQREHLTLGQSPRNAFNLGIALGGSREVRRVEYDQTFRILTLPSPQNGNTRVVQPGCGVKIRNIYYWCDAFLDPEIENSSVDVRANPFDVGIAYALVRGRWEECISDYYQYLTGRTEKEIMVVTEDLLRRKSGHGKRVEVSDKELVEHLNRAEAIEGELLKQRLFALENKMVLDIIEGQNISLRGDSMLNVESKNHPLSNQHQELASQSLQNAGSDLNELECYGEF